MSYAQPTITRDNAIKTLRLVRAQYAIASSKVARKGRDYTGYLRTIEAISAAILAMGGTLDDPP